MIVMITAITPSVKAYNLPFSIIRPKNRKIAEPLDDHTGFAGVEPRAVPRGSNGGS